MNIKNIIAIFISATIIMTITGCASSMSQEEKQERIDFAKNRATNSIKTLLPGGEILGMKCFAETFNTGSDGCIATVKHENKLYTVEDDRWSAKVIPMERN